MNLSEEEFEEMTPEIRMLILRMIEAQLEALKAMYVRPKAEERPNGGQQVA